MSDEVRVTLRLPKPIHAFLATKAREEGRSLNAQIVYGLALLTGMKDSRPRRGFKRRRTSGREHVR